jgi:hypothetical protein
LGSAAYLQGSQVMKINEMLEKIEEVCNQRIEVKGYISVTYPFSYMHISDAEEKYDNCVLLLDENIIKCLEAENIPRLVGSPVLYAGFITLVGRIYKNSGFPMFSAVIRNISEISFEYSCFENESEQTCLLQKKFFEPKKNLYLQGGKPLNNKQIQTIKSLVKGSDNFIAIKDKFSKPGNHLLAFYLDTPKLNQLQQQLEQVGLTNYFWEYSENNTDAFDVAGGGYLYR